MKNKLIGVVCICVFILGCNITKTEEDNINTDGSQPDNNKSYSFPPYITPIESYFEFSIDEDPVISEESYKLEIHGLVEKPYSYTLSELRKMPMHERFQTTECIGNQPNGELIGTVLWKGFSVYDLLVDSLGLKENARTVNFICADGYVSSNSLEELESLEVIGAIYANQEVLPIKMGFPLRILNTGYYGVKNPGWVTEIEVTSEGKKDYWIESSWKVDDPMEVDSKIFFPDETSVWSVGDTIPIGGAAFGSNPIVSVEYSIDGGDNWMFADIVKTSEGGNAWVFWKTNIVAETSGDFNLRTRATDFSGHTQPLIDNFGFDGTNSSPIIQLIIR